MKTRRPTPLRGPAYWKPRECLSCRKPRLTPSGIRSRLTSLPSERSAARWRSPAPVGANRSRGARAPGARLRARAAVVWRRSQTARLRHSRQLTANGGASFVDRRPSGRIGCGPNPGGHVNTS